LKKTRLEVNKLHTFFSAVGQPETSEDASALSTAAQNRPPPCRIALADQVVVADHVIYSASLGVLKATAHHFFSPQLPPRKMLAIEASL
jgi:hypothetical protein